MSFKLPPKAAKEIDNLFLETVLLCLVLPASLLANVMFVVLWVFYS